MVVKDVHVPSQVTSDMKDVLKKSSISIFYRNYISSTCIQDVVDSLVEESSTSILDDICKHEDDDTSNTKYVY